MRPEWLRRRFAWVLALGACVVSCTAADAERAAPTTAPAVASETAATRPVGPTTRTAAVPRHDIPGLPNFARVSDGLYRGGQPTAEGFAQLKKMGVKTVVNLRSFSSDRRKLKGTGLRYAHIYCKAWHPEDEDTLKFLTIVSDPANHPVFVHCMHGADRTGCAVAVYRVLVEGWGMEDAVKEMHDFGFHPIWTQIIDYLEDFKPEKVRRKLEKTETPDIDVVE
jgi:tyrosine-protein phosphatase SIW14